MTDDDEFGRDFEVPPLPSKLHGALTVAEIEGVRRRFPKMETWLGHAIPVIIDGLRLSEAARMRARSPSAIKVAVHQVWMKHHHIKASEANPFLLLGARTRNLLWNEGLRTRALLVARWEEIGEEGFRNTDGFGDTSVSEIMQVFSLEGAAREEKEPGRWARLRAALHAAIARPAGVVPPEALEFYDAAHPALGDMAQRKS